MIKSTLGRQDVEGLLRENVHIICILGREGNIIFLGGNSEFCG